jgi:hypothetical protein
MTREHQVIFVPVTVAAWLLITYLWPRMLLWVFKKAILTRGVGNGPIPINTLQPMPEALFADPLHAPASASKLATTGVNRDTLYVVGWLDLSKESLVLHVPEMAGRYYSVQFTDPSKNTNFAYVGKRTTGTHAGDYLITGPHWKGRTPGDMQQISSPNTSVFVLGRVFVEDDRDISAAYSLAKQIQLTPRDVEAQE